VPPSSIGNTQKSLSQERDRWFESGSLQQTVSLSLDFSFLYRKAGSCRGVRGFGQVARPAETRRAVNITPTADNIYFYSAFDFSVLVIRDGSWLFPVFRVPCPNLAQAVVPGQRDPVEADRGR
jgi:hypothetical protein